MLASTSAKKSWIFATWRTSPSSARTSARMMWKGSRRLWKPLLRPWMSCPRTYSSARSTRADTSTRSPSPVRNLTCSFGWMTRLASRTPWASPAARMTPSTPFVLPSTHIDTTTRLYAMPSRIRRWAPWRICSQTGNSCSLTRSVIKRSYPTKRSTWPLATLSTKTHDGIKS